MIILFDACLFTVFDACRPLGGTVNPAVNRRIRLHQVSVPSRTPSHISEENGHGSDPQCPKTAARPTTRLERDKRLLHLDAEERTVLEAFGQRVREMRLAASAAEMAAGGERITLAVLASRADLDASTMGELERGRVNATLAVMLRIARVLGVSVAQLCEPPARLVRKRRTR